MKPTTPLPEPEQTTQPLLKTITSSQRAPTFFKASTGAAKKPEVVVDDDTYQGALKNK